MTATHTYTAHYTRKVQGGAWVIANEAKAVFKDAAGRVLRFTGKNAESIAKSVAAEMTTNGN